MIRRTFQHLAGVGPWREKDLWARGVLKWEDFPSQELVLSAEFDGAARERLVESERLLREGKLQELARLIPPREHWRLYDAFESEAVFLDVEATGTSIKEVTVVSLVSPRSGLQVFIRGKNLEQLPSQLNRFPIWVSFNGSCFDEPVLKEAFPGLDSPPVHIDLRFVGRRFGFTGSLKEIEAQTGFGRPPHLSGLNGLSAVNLWRAFEEQRELAALRLLVEYNLYDTLSLRTLLDRIWNQALVDFNFDDPPRAVFDRGEVLYDVSQILLSL